MHNLNVEPTSGINKYNGKYKHPSKHDKTKKISHYPFMGIMLRYTLFKSLILPSSILLKHTQGRLNSPLVRYPASLPARLQTN